MSSRDVGRGKERLKVGVMLPLRDRGRLKPVYTIDKYRDLDAFNRGERYERVVIDHNCFLNEGIDLLWSLGCGGAGTPFDNANAFIGVGDSTEPADPVQTGLQALVNKLYKEMDDGYPEYGSDQLATWRATFDAGEANWQWNEVTVANGDSDADVNLNRLVQTVGTKASPGVWTVSLQILIV